MRFVIQRVSSASVTVNDLVTGQINEGFLVLIGICQDDNEAVADRLIRKMTGLRIFADAEGKTNLSLKDVGGSLLLVSQFTLYADCRKGNRPSFQNSGSPVHAEKIYNYIVEQCRKFSKESADSSIRVETGIFAEHMTVSLVNNGPFTIILDSKEL